MRTDRGSGMLLGVSWPWWVLAGVAAYGVVRISALVAATAADVRGMGAFPASPGWFRPHLVVLPAGWILLGGFAAGAAAYSAVSTLLGPGDRDLSRMLGAAGAVIGFLIGAILDVRLVLWTRRSLEPRLIARELSRDRESLELGDEPDRLHAARRMARMGAQAAPAIDLLASAASTILPPMSVLRSGKRCRTRRWPPSRSRPVWHLRRWMIRMSAFAPSRPAMRRASPPTTARSARISN